MMHILMFIITTMATLPVYPVCMYSLYQMLSCELPYPQVFFVLFDLESYNVYTSELQRMEQDMD